MRCGTSLGVVAATSTTALKCGPSPSETGQAVLLVAPLVLLGGLLAQALILHLWRRRHDDTLLRWQPTALLLFLVSIPSVAVLALAHAPMNWAGLALWLFGCSYVSILLVSTRLWMIWDRRNAFALAHLPPLLLFIGPALLMATGLWEGPPTHKPEDFFVAPGCLGWTTGPLFLALLVEAALRGRRPRTSL
jgi:hypothetical protein